MFHGERIPRYVNIETIAMRKLAMLDSAGSLNDLKIPPSNRLERLKGDLEGHWSIRINDQWRVCFTWNGQHAEHVRIVDYH